MIRAVLYLFRAIILISLIRSVIGILGKAIGGFVGGSGSAGGASPAEPRKAGELKRDPVCGTYIASSNSVRKVINGETLYFCSPECRDKYPPS